MQLTVAERYALLSILPREGSFTTLKVVRKLRESLSFNEEEIKLYAIKEVVNGDRLNVVWDPSIPQEADVPIGPQAQVIICTALEGLEKAKKLTERELTIYEKFMGEEG